MSAPHPYSSVERTALAMLVAHCEPPARDDAIIFTVPFEGAYGLRIEGFDIGAWTIALAAPNHLGSPQWELHLLSDEGTFWRMSTHVQNEILDRHPWVEQMLIERGILAKTDPELTLESSSE